ncbi:uncharacterized protein RHOBADRAFT_53663, partial [Rhodotorula graminis WP1]
ESPHPKPSTRPPHTPPPHTPTPLESHHVRRHPRLDQERRERRRIPEPRERDGPGRPRRGGWRDGEPRCARGPHGRAARRRRRQDDPHARQHWRGQRDGPAEEGRQPPGGDGRAVAPAQRGPVRVARQARQARQHERRAPRCRRRQQDVWQRGRGLVGVGGGGRLGGRREARL